MMGCELARAVAGQHKSREDAGARADVDDDAASSGAHAGEHRPSDVHHAGDVDRELLHEALAGVPSKTF
jgi:hypothetical protein